MPLDEKVYQAQSFINIFRLLNTATLPLDKKVYQAQIFKLQQLLTAVITRRIALLLSSKSINQRRTPFHKFASLSIKHFTQILHCHFQKFCIFNQIFPSNSPLSPRTLYFRNSRHVHKARKRNLKYKNSKFD